MTGSSSGEQWSDYSGATWRWTDSFVGYFRGSSSGTAMASGFVRRVD